VLSRKCVCVWVCVCVCMCAYEHEVNVCACVLSMRTFKSTYAFEQYEHICTHTQARTCVVCANIQV